MFSSQYHKIVTRYFKSSKIHAINMEAINGLHESVQLNVNFGDHDRMVVQVQQAGTRRADERVLRHTTECDRRDLRAARVLLDAGLQRRERRDHGSPSRAVHEPPRV